MRLFSAEQGSRLRAVLRAAIALAVAFGLSLSGVQIAAIIALLDAVLQLGVKLDEKWIKP
jgi:hypothetical protein